MSVLFVLPRIEPRGTGKVSFVFALICVCCITITHLSPYCLDGRPGEMDATECRVNLISLAALLSHSNKKGEGCGKFNYLFSSDDYI